ncbi:MAG: hypothetical protein COV35_05680 [Alphaproteobacteria bacterium CG11_big_fil_rev_8_21_14_0_20_39_49]|nr:MAG: hypothetical protein COV35_05680 [Alphaproteobacteria bacterium CG11_big_fil_rev_8_21_14_0_20_39_49]
MQIHEQSLYNGNTVTSLAVMTAFGTAGGLLTASLYQGFRQHNEIQDIAGRENTACGIVTGVLIGEQICKQSGLPTNSNMAIAGYLASCTAINTINKILSYGEQIAQERQNAQNHRDV